MSIKVHLKDKYSDKNAGFCEVCINDLKILKFWSNYKYGYRQ